jgi:heme/copper-type cytochrome/quinol oxidase subunit 3
MFLNISSSKPNQLYSIGGVYNAGYFRMSTWIPFVWALINTLVLILSSFAIQGAL